MIESKLELCPRDHGAKVAACLASVYEASLYKGLDSQSELLGSYASPFFIEVYSSCRNMISIEKLYLVNIDRNIFEECEMYGLEWKTLTWLIGLLCLGVSLFHLRHQPGANQSCRILSCIVIQWVINGVLHYHVILISHLHLHPFIDSMMTSLIIEGYDIFLTKSPTNFVWE